MRKIPIGIQDFKKLRDEDYYYMDKSDLIAQILDGGAEVYLFTRPRRFGKSLNLSMMDAFLNVEHKGNTWFDGLRISERDDLEPRKNASPVLYFDFKGLSTGSYEDFIKDVGLVVSDLFIKYTYVLEQDLHPTKIESYRKLESISHDDSLLKRSFSLLMDLMESYHGSKVVVLIDEYDNPIQNAYGTEDFQRILDFMKLTLESILKGNKSLDFAVVTGVMQISKESIFSGLNNSYIDNILSTESDEMFGFTQVEVKRLCDDYGHPERYEEAKDWYDGYVFGDAEIYNPWSVLNYVSRKFKPFPYWAGTSGNSIIEDLMSRTGYSTAVKLRILASGGSIREAIDPTIAYSDLRSNQTAIYSMMAMAGYLKVIPNGELYDLSIPNREMFGVFANMLVRGLINGSSSLYKFTDSIVSCDTDLMSLSLYELMSDTVGFRVLDNEHSYQAFITGVLMYLSGRYRVTADMEAGNGYYDIRLERIVGDGPNILIEIKRRRDSDGSKRTEELAEEALAQIKKKDYIHGLKGDTILYGVAFDGKLPSVIAERTVL
ncbi:AAA family ATPase [Candidatus Methanoprimaticola sp. MG2]|uniref:AAA family ATPase n=1 Tax=Candidatus Methanoprimaticola sp. MG2 TaxID=3228838 RepID=UPI0039C65136